MKRIILRDENAVTYLAKYKDLEIILKSIMIDSENFILRDKFTEEITLIVTK